MSRSGCGDALIEMAGTWLRLAQEHDNGSPMTQVPPNANHNQDYAALSCALH
jgi:hypothetical protein